MIPHIFKPGDPAIVCNTPEDWGINGEHVIVVSGPSIRRHITCGPNGLYTTAGFGYVIAHPEGGLAFAEPYYLRPLPGEPTPDWKSMSMRDDLVRDEKRPARVPHPAIAGILDLLGQEFAS